MLNDKYGTDVYGNGVITWFAIRNAPENVQRLLFTGFSLSGSGVVYDNINKSYPYFDLHDYPKSENDKPTAKIYESHFKSLLNYQLDNLDFLETISDGFNYKEYYQSALNYINENGVKTYGIVAIGKPSDIIKICEEPFVCKITIEGLALSER